MDSFGEAIDIKMEIFEAIEDNYGGVIVNMKKEEPMDSLKFHTMLRVSISHWKLKVCMLYLIFTHFVIFEFNLYASCRL